MKRWLAWLVTACSAASTAAAEPPCRADLRVAPETPYVEQAVHWELRIESRAAASRIEWLDAPAFPSARAERVTILPGSREETEWHLRRDERVLFPERPGRLVLPTIRLVCVSDGTSHELEIATRVLQVQPLPEEGRPADFSGLVGRVTLRRYVRPEALTLGGTARISVSLRGAGNVWAGVDPHEHLELGDADLFRRPTQTDIERGGGLRVTEVFEADLVPRRSGVLRLPELGIHWFDPESGRYETETAPPVELPVAEPRGVSPGRVDGRDDRAPR